LDNHKTIPILGVDNQLLDDQSPDGLCEEIINLKPRGRTDKSFWSPFENIDLLKNNSSTPFTYTHGINYIKNAFWQIRNRVNEKFDSTSSTTLERIIVLCEKSGRCAIDIIDPLGWTIVKTLDLPDTTGYDFTATRIKEITVINITLNDKPDKIYYLIDDLFLEQGWPELPKISFTKSQEVFTEAETTAGAVYGVKQDATSYHIIRYAFKLYNGTYIRHSTPILVKVAGTAIDYAYMVNTFRLEGYTEPLLNKSFWETQIAGVSCFMSPRSATLKEILNEGLLFEAVFFPSLDLIPEAQWPTAENENIKKAEISTDNLIVQNFLNIDGFSSHKSAARVIDSYNQRLLLGGKSTDFGLPFAQVNGTSILGVDIQDFLALDMTLTSFDQESEYYTSDGTPTTFDSKDYTVEEYTAFKVFTPLEGEEILASSVVSSNTPVGTESAPHTEDLPNATFTVDHATYSGDNVKCQILHRESFAYGDAYTPSMVVELQIGPTGGSVTKVVRFKLTIGAEGNALPLTQFQIVSQTEGSLSSYELYHQVKLITDNGEYTRTFQNVVLNDNPEFKVPPLIAYPDRRAVSYLLVIKNGADYETIFDQKLIQHPASNYSYTNLTNDGSDFTYTLEDGSLVSEPDDSLNLINEYSPNEVQASETNQPFNFSASTLYRIGNRENDIIQAFAVNSMDISQGQFGQYPLYVISNKSIWALEQSSDPNVVFGRIVPIDTMVGVTSPYATCNADRNVIIIDRNSIYSLAGHKLQRIDRPISFDDEYNSFIQNARVAYHEANDYEEVIFSNPSYPYSWYYNLRFNRWYKGTESFKIFIQKQPFIQAINTSNEVKNFEDKITNENTVWSLKTRPLNFGTPYILKRINRSLLRLKLTQEEEVDSNDYKSLRVKVYGQKDNHSEGFLILDKIYKNQITKDIWIRTNFGSFQTFRIEINGESFFENSSINEFEMNVQARYNDKIRR
jgi:hypothetical protein